MFARKRRRSRTCPRSSPICPTVCREISETGRQSVIARSERTSVRLLSSLIPSPSMLDVHAQVFWIGVHRVYTRLNKLCFGQVGRLRSLVRIPKPWTIPEQLFLLPPRQVGESFWSGRTLEGKVAVAIDPGEPHEGFLQLLAAHALDRIAPEAIDLSNNTHVRTPFRDAPHKSSVWALLSFPKPLYLPNTRTSL